MSSRSLTPRREQEIRGMDPNKYPEVAELFSLIDGQRSVIRGKDSKIERQRAQIANSQARNTELRKQVAQLEAEIERLREQSA
ncbi:hypothetical protein [Streptomyces anulatus]|uniref:hypothetical protein n=1 Tax=Streptomyces anulatus TaxID=1892 RepID=UPI002E0FA70C|nr:hypothetical protein OG274_38450 [Streptomyces anulatus]